MAIGRTFQESFQKAIRGLEISKDGLNEIYDPSSQDLSTLKKELSIPSPDRGWFLADAIRSGLSIQEIFNLTKVDPWFIAQIEDLVKEEEILRSLSLNSIKKDYFLSVKKKGFSDRRLATLFKVCLLYTSDAADE